MLSGQPATWQQEKAEDNLIPIQHCAQLGMYLCSFAGLNNLVSGGANIITKYLPKVVLIDDWPVF